MPVYNEAKSVRIVIEEVLELHIDGIQINLIVVGGGSTDGTDEIILEFALIKNVTVLIQDKPRGKGNAVREGFKHIRDGIVLIQDGDTEYRVDEYSKLLNPILDGRTDFVLGSRYTDSPMRKFGRYGVRSSFMNIGHKFFTFLFNSLYNVKLDDPFTMFKVFRSHCISGLDFESNRFDFDYELLSKIVRRGYIPLEVPVTYVSRGFAEGKKIRIFRDPLTWLVALIKFKYVSIEPQEKNAYK
jgi:glycosyltransferase involved in cell wall biosynthesis